MSPGNKRLLWTLAALLVGGWVILNMYVHNDRIARREGYEAMSRTVPLRDEIGADLLRSKAPSPRTIAPVSPEGPVTEVLADGRIVLRFPERFQHGTVTYSATIRDGKATWGCVAEGDRLQWARARCREAP